MARELLVSICNVAAHPRPSCLLRLDVETQRADWVDTGVGELLVSGAGICSDERYVYHVSIVEAGFATVLSIFDRTTLAVVHVETLEEVSDAHSLLRQGDDLLVASTGTDEIVAYRLDGPKTSDARVIWTPTGSGTDTHHINSLALANGDVLCSAFGAKEADSWASATNGYIHNVTRDTPVVGGLRQPHTASWRDGGLYFCNSQEGSVNTTAGVVAFLAGYSRGLAFGPDGTLFAGTSVSRRPSSTSGDTAGFMNPMDPGEPRGQCAVVQLNPEGGHRVEVGMASFGHEIYDVFIR
jgi:glucose/arabinose dehydrogenase